jgi:hypothetical protein
VGRRAEVSPFVCTIACQNVNLCLPARVQHSAEKRIFVMAITSPGQGRR